MTTPTINNTINLFLKLTENIDKKISHQYLCLLDNGVEVKLEGLKISQPTKIIVKLDNISKVDYIISECLIPCDQKTVTATIKNIEQCDDNMVIVIDRNNEVEPKNYNFIIIVQNRTTKQQTVCDPQVRNTGGF